MPAFAARMGRVETAAIAIEKNPEAAHDFELLFRAAMAAIR